MSDGLWDFLLGREQNVYQDGVMSPVIGTKREGGMLGAVAEPLSWAPGPTGLIAGAVDAYAKGGASGLLSNAGDIVLGAVGGKAAPMVRKIAAGENARKIPKQVAKSIDDAYEFGVPGQKFDDKVWMGLEGRPRWEISDRKAAIVKGIDAYPQGATLDRILKHDELFDQYPQLKGYRVYPLSAKPGGMESMERGALGAHDADKKIIYLKDGMSPKEQLSVLLHELQHGVQAIEGHASGASNTAATHLAINMVENWKKATPEKQRLLRAQMKSEFGFDPEKDSVTKLADRMYQKKYGEVEARTTQARHEQTLTKERTEIREDHGDFMDTMGKDKFSPILWQDTWKQMFGHRELPPFVNLETGKTIPIKDF